MTDARLAVDIGGTFTDIALARADGARFTFKTLTTPRAPEEGVMAGVASALAEAALSPSDIGVVIHGATLATNALIEKRGAKTALLVTEGHRDSLEMAYENRFEQYDVMIDRPPPLVPRWLRLPIRERMNASGAPLVPLAPQTVADALEIIEAEGVESLAVAFLHAYANPAHERAVAEIVSRARPDLPISLSSEVAPEIREYERQTTTVANAYVRPLMERYLRRLGAALAAGGFSCPFLLMTSGGGLCGLEAAARFPVRLIESGPAGGAILAASVARSIGLETALSFDMGGTTAKLCFIDNGAPTTARVFECDRSYRFKKGSGTPLRIPVIEMIEIGAGGGSIASIDRLGRLAVGPESAGAEPGPAAYGRGGAAPTVTDADIVLGRVDSVRFAAGAIVLDTGAARRVIAECVGAPLNLSTDEAAHGVAEIVDENMAAAARAHASEEGRDVRAGALVAFGGAAPLHAARLAEKLGIDRIVVPEGAGVGSAIGFLMAPAAYEIIRSLPMRLDALDGARVLSLFADMRAEAEEIVRAAAPGAPIIETRAAFLRYAGQGHEIAAPIGAGGAALTAVELQTSFEAAYAALYGRTIPGMAIEAMSWSLKLAAPAPEARLVTPPQAIAPATIIETREAFDAAHGKRVAHAVVARADMRAGDIVNGPALIVESQTTTVVTGAFDALADEAGNLVLIRKGRI